MDKKQRNLLDSVKKSIDGLTGGTSAWDFKDYVFSILFYRFLSSNIIKYIKENYRRNYDKMSDEESLKFKEDIIKNLDYFIKPSELFQRIVKEKIDSNYLDIILDSIFKNIEKSSSKKLTDTFKIVNLQSKQLGEEGEERSKKTAGLLNAINKIKYDINEGMHDTLGDAYEFFLGNYNKSHSLKQGVFYTPNTVAKLLNNITLIYGKDKPKNIYDPTCGSGSLLINYIRFNKNVIVHGQEKSYDTYSLCKMNMILNNVKEYHITNGDTLLQYNSNEKEKYDLILSNPPFGISWNPSLITPDDERFNKLPNQPPKNKADYAFIMHILYTLGKDGLALIIDTPTMLSRDNDIEKSIRKYLVEENVIDTILLLPRDLFTNTTTDICIFICKKNKINNNILFVNASTIFTKEGSNTILSDNDIETICELIKNKKDVKKISHLASLDEIIKNDYNLHVVSYVKYENKLEEEIKPNNWLNNISRPNPSNTMLLLNSKNNCLIEKSIKLNKSINNNLDNITKHGVKYLSIKNISTVNSGLNKRSKFKPKSIYPYYYITSKEIDDGQIIPSDNTQRIDEVAKDLVKQKTKLEINDILFAISESEIKTTVITEEELDYSMDENVYIIKIKPNYKDKIDPYYLRYVMASDFFKSQVSNNLANSKAKRINKGNFEKLLIPVIPLDAQKQISMSFIELEKAYIDIKNQIMKDLFVKKKEYKSRINESIKLIQNDK